jgi:16S rRNA C1402 N4-methylase RsmH
VDAATKKYFDTKFSQAKDLTTDLFRVTDHGDEKPGRSNHHEVIRQEVKDLRTQVNRELTELHHKVDQITKALERMGPPRNPRD